MSRIAGGRQHLATLGSAHAMGKLGLVFAGSRVLGLGRELAVAYALGTTAAADRVAGALLVASAVGYVLGEAVFAGSVSRIAGGDSPSQRLQTYGDSFGVALRVAILAVGAYALLGSLGTVALLGTWTDGFQKTAVLSLLLAPSVGAYVLSSCINGWLTVERRFVLLNAVQVLYSVGVIGLLAIAWSAGTDLKAEAIVAGWSLGNIAALAVLLVLAGPHGTRSAKAATGALLKIGAPLAIGSALLATQSITNRAVAARLETGDVAALGYADRLFLLPVGFVLAVVGPIILGSLAVAAATAPKRALGASTIEHLRLVSTVAVPVSLAFAALAPLAVPLLFQYGAFTESSTTHTTEALNGLAVGLAAISMVLVLVRVLQATGRHRDLIRLTVWAAALNAVLAVAGGVALGLAGVALSASVVGAVTVLAGIEGLGRHFGRDWRQDARRLVTLPMLACTGALAALLVAEEVDALGEDVRLSVIGVGAAATTTVALAGRRRVSEGP